jgi:hypothetical protein
MKAPFDILISADGRIFAHNLTPALAAVLAELNPDDEAMQVRAGGENTITSRIEMKNNGATNDEPRTTST